MFKYQASRYINDQYTMTEFDTAEEAALAVEQAGEGSVVKFIVVPNLHEDGLNYNSLRLWVYQDGKWDSRSIFSGLSVSLGEERPNAD